MKWLPFLFILLSTPFYADAASTFWRVTASNSNVNGFVFRITATPPTADGSMAFLIQIVSRQTRFSQSPVAALAEAKFSQAPAPDAESRTIRALNMNRRDDTITLGFSIDEKSLKNPNLCFFFTNYVEVELNGKLVPAASADFFYVRLNDFIQRPSEDDKRTQ